MRRIGVLTAVTPAGDPDGQARLAAFLQVLQQLGWTDGSNVRIDYRWDCQQHFRKYAAELGALAPDVILSVGTASMESLLQATRTVPIVFVFLADPVGSAFVDSLARPGGNATGFTQFEYGLTAMALIRSTSFAARPATSIASSRARSRATCPCRLPPSTN
jgi:putative tryptophan/tyrosine transport system substrate-binding protein